MKHIQTLSPALLNRISANKSVVIVGGAIFHYTSLWISIHHKLISYGSDSDIDLLKHIPAYLFNEDLHISHELFSPTNCTHFGQYGFSEINGGFAIRRSLYIVHMKQSSRLEVIQDTLNDVVHMFEHYICTLPKKKQVSFNSNTCLSFHKLWPHRVCWHWNWLSIGYSPYTICGKPQLLIFDSSAQSSPSKLSHNKFQQTCINIMTNKVKQMYQ